MAKVSIIIPIYNVEKYLIKTVGSVINQTEREIEIILVDDGSTDGSGLICDKFALQDQRIIVIHKGNEGLSSARNAGAKVASSDYVMFLDGDDYLKGNAVERLLQVMKEYPSDFIQFYYQEVKEGEEPVEQQTFGKILRAYTPKELFENLYKIGGEGASGCTKFFRRELVEKVPFINIQHEDEMWCTQAFMEPLTVTYIPEVLYYYVMRADSIVHSKFNYQKLDIFTVLNKRIEALDKLGLKEYKSIEYRRVFMSVINLYCQARKVRDEEAMFYIRSFFDSNKRNIGKHAQLDGKFILLYSLMKYCYSLIEIYYFYWKFQH